MITYLVPFKVGDRVKVKTRKEFEEDYKVTRHESNKKFHASCPASFVVEMNKYCGMLLTIKAIIGEGNKDNSGVFLEENPRYAWTLSMVKHIENPFEQLTLGVE